MNLCKRSFTLLCLVALVVVCLPAAHAEVKEIQAISAHEGKLYAIADYTSVLVREGDEWHQILKAHHSLEQMAWEGDTCYLVTSGMLQPDRYETEWVLQAATLSLDGLSMIPGEAWSLEEISNECDIPWFLQVVVQDGQAYLLVLNPQDSVGVHTIWKVDTATGKVRKLVTGKIQGLNLWRDGMLLVQNDDGYAALNTVDVQTGRLTQVLALESHLEDSAPAYDSASGNVYFLQNGLLMCWDGESAPEACAVTGLAPDLWDAGQAVICGNEYVILRDGEVYFFPTDGEMPEQTELTVEGFSVETTLTNLFAGFSVQRTDVRCQTMGGWMSRDEIAQRLITHAPLPDIYHSYSDWGYYNMARKGFFVDLSDLESVSALVDTMAPAVQALVKREDGALMGLPVEMRDSMSFGLNYNRDVLYAIGLTEDDLPRTLEEMLDFIEEWGEKITNYRDANGSSYALFDGDNGTYRTLVYTFLNTQLATLSREEKPMTLDNPALQRALKRLEGMRDRLPAMKKGEQYANRSILSLFQTISSALVVSDIDSYQPLFLAVDEDHAPVYPVSVRIMVINPYASAAQQEVAKSFLTYTAENLDAWEHIKLSPDFSTPKLRDDFAEDWKSAAEAVENARADLEIAPEEQKRIFEERLEWAEANLAQVEADRYAVSPERIESIHMMSENFVPLLRTFDETTAGSELLNRYIMGSISTEEFLKQMERVLQMQQAEDE